jgi:DNA-binding helix-hairpin-helix protein with protein kinase domain
MPDVVNGRGEPVRLGRELARGGEGAVFEVAADGNLVAKIYHTAPTREKAEKIRIMAGLRNERIAKLTAWPVELLSKRSGEPIGLLMPKVTGRTDVHNLYSPKSRRQKFLRADWRFLIRASANIARAFAVVHETGCVIGDVNHGGVLVAQDATVRLIDCDSFQVIAGGRKFLCEVGVETFTPPELQGRPFAGLVRTQNHDTFGLAVMVFLMLFMGRHPFSGKYLGKGEMPLAKAIEQFRFAYSTRPAGTEMQRPPGTPPLSIVGTEVAMMFERAFSRESAVGNRPTAQDWAVALQKLEGQLQQCKVNASHWHLRGLAACPWCAMEGATGVSLFPVIVPSAGGTFDIEAFWREVTDVRHPGPAPELSVASADPSPKAIGIGRATRRSKGLAVAAAVAAVIGGMFLLPVESAWFLLLIFGFGAYFGVKAMLDKSTDVEAFRRQHDAASSRWTLARNEWNNRSGAQAFDKKRADLDRLRKEWGEIPNVRLRKLEALKNEQRRIQLERFLDNFEIEDASIPGIGAGRKQTLESFGIETAEDIQMHKLQSVPGFGPKLQGNLLAWRRSLEQRFVFDPNRGIDPQDQAKVEQEVLRERQRIEAVMAKALAELKQVRAQILATRDQLKPQVEAAQREYAQAVADYRAIQQ